MDLRFIREIPIKIVIKASSKRRGFLFHLGAGFYKQLDPLTGMSVDLVLVDKWLEDLKSDLEKKTFLVGGPFTVDSTCDSKSLNSLSPDSYNVFNPVFAEIMAVSRLYLTEKTEQAGVFLKSLNFREEREWSISWNSIQTPESLYFSYPFYLEFFFKESFELLKVSVNWLRVQSCEADFYQESLKLVKLVQLQSPQNLNKEFEKLIGIKLSSGSFIKSVEVKHVSENYSVVY